MRYNFDEFIDLKKISFLKYDFIKKIDVPELAMSLLGSDMDFRISTLRSKALMAGTVSGCSIFFLATMILFAAGGILYHKVYFIGSDNMLYVGENIATRDKPG